MLLTTSIKRGMVVSEKFSNDNICQFWDHTKEKNDYDDELVPGVLLTAALKKLRLLIGCCGDEWP